MCHSGYRLDQEYPQLQIRLYSLWSSQSLLNPKIIWKNILQNQNFLRFDASISLISTGYVNVDSQTSLLLQLQNSLRSIMRFYECSPTRLMFMLQFVLPNEDTRKSDCNSLSSWCMLWTTELCQIHINEPGKLC